METKQTKLNQNSMEELKQQVDDASLDFLFGEALPRVWAKDEEDKEDEECQRKSFDEFFKKVRYEDLFTPELKAYWMKQGFSEDMANRYANEFYYIEWTFEHVNFQEKFQNYKEDCIKHFLDEGYTEEALIEFFRVNWKMDASEIRAIINKVKPSPYAEEERKKWNEAAQNEDLTNYVLLFNMLNLKNYKSWAELIREYGRESTWCDDMLGEISYFARAYGLDYSKFREVISPSFDFYIAYFEEHPDVEVLGVVDKEASDKIQKVISEIWEEDPRLNEGRTMRAWPLDLSDVLDSDIL